MKFTDSSKYTYGASKLTRILEQLSQNNCEIAVVGTMASKLVRQEKSSLSLINMVENASVLWEFLKGRKLPGVMAVDRVCLNKLYFFTPLFNYIFQERKAVYSQNINFQNYLVCLLCLNCMDFAIRILEMTQFLEIIFSLLGAP